MGPGVRAHFGDAVYSVGFSASSGTQRQLWEKPEEIELPPKGSLVCELRQYGEPLLFVDLRRGGPFSGRIVSTQIGYAAQEACWSEIVDGVLYTREMDPRQVVAYLNDYLQAMTDAVFEHDGAIDKYAGDGIMALFGVPVAHGDHARRAAATAIDMQAALLKLQTHWETEGLPVADIGIGINTGEVVVGNIGSTQRVDFTVIGDPVNLAERVEGLTKVLSAPNLVTEATYRHVQGEARTRTNGRSSGGER